MAIGVTKYMVSNDLGTIDLDVTLDEGDYIAGLLMWTEGTYRDPRQSIDLSHKIDGTNNTLSTELSTADAGVSQFTGIYFLQITTNNGEAIVVATMNLTQYYVVQAKVIANINLSCLNCNTNFQNALLFDLYLEATKNALLLGRYQDAINNLSKLIITIDTSDCDECQNITPVVSTAGNIVSVGVIDCELATDD